MFFFSFQVKEKGKRAGGCQDQMKTTEFMIQEKNNKFYSDTSRKHLTLQEYLKNFKNEIIKVASNKQLKPKRIQNQIMLCVILFFQYHRHQERLLPMIDRFFFERAQNFDQEGGWKVTRERNRVLERKTN